MNWLLDLMPLIVFFTVFKLYDLYVATLATIGVSVAHSGWLYLTQKQVPTHNLIATFAFVVFGGMTLLFQDLIYIKWKPSFANWLLAAILLIGNLSSKPVPERLLSSKIPSISRSLWRELGFIWVVFFTAMGFLNLYVAFYFRVDLPESMRDEIWVNFKVFGLLILTLIFMVLQALYLQIKLRKQKTAE